MLQRTELFLDHCMYSVSVILQFVVQNVRLIRTLVASNGLEVVIFCDVHFHHGFIFATLIAISTRTFECLGVGLTRKIDFMSLDVLPAPRTCPTTLMQWYKNDEGTSRLFPEVTYFLTSSRLLRSRMMYGWAKELWQNRN